MLFKFPNTSKDQVIATWLSSQLQKKNPDWICSWFGLIQINKLDKNATHQNKQINDKNQENDLN